MRKNLINDSLKCVLKKFKNKILKNNSGISKVPKY